MINNRTLTESQYRFERDNTACVIVPQNAIHIPHSRTYGGCNSFTQIQSDDFDLGRTFVLDYNTYRLALLEYGLSQSEIDAIFHDLNHLNMLRKFGVELCFDSNSILKSFHLHSEDHEGYCQYEGLMPYSIKYDDCLNVVLGKIGDDFEFNEGVLDALLGQIYPWVKVDHINYFIHIEFNLDLESIRLMTLMSKIK